MDLERAGYEKTDVPLREMMTGLRALPNVQEVSLSQSLPFHGRRMSFGMPTLEGYEKRAGEGTIMVRQRRVGPDYFAAMGIPLVKGKELTGPILPGQVLDVNESFVRRYWPEVDPLGKRIFGTEVIGVARDSRGARRGEILWLVFRQGAIVTAIGLGLGLLGADVAARAIHSWLYEVRALDAWSIVTTITIIVISAALSCLIPVQRASRVEPVKALRVE